MLRRNSQTTCLCLVFVLFILTVTGSAQSKRPELIIDTDTAEGKETADLEAPKEPNPLLSEQNLQIGNFYFKKKNYAAAIQRFLEAIEYQPNSVKAYEALAKAYEKKGEYANAIKTCRDFIEKFPESPKSPEFRERVAKLEKKL